jgi:hypothetical protein
MRLDRQNPRFERAVDRGRREVLDPERAELLGEGLAIPEQHRADVIL